MKRHNFTRIALFLSPNFGEGIVKSNLVLVMEAGQKEALQVEFPRECHKIYLLSEVADSIPYDIPDPFGPDSGTHQEIAKELYELIKRGFGNICKLALDISISLH